jgi:bifunctional DNA-binding transcriptional regulator/antitoxin component of YhaV-PrlF toxin-antitoxin module
MTLHPIGETTITGKNQVSLPAQGLRQLGWTRGDHLLVEVVGEEFMILMRRPANWTQAFAGRMSDVFGTPEETRQELEQERRSWREWESEHVGSRS